MYASAICSPISFPSTFSMYSNQRSWNNQNTSWVWILQSCSSGELSFNSLSIRSINATIASVSCSHAMKNMNVINSWDEHSARIFPAWDTANKRGTRSNSSRNVCSLSCTGTLQASKSTFRWGFCGFKDQMRCAIALHLLEIDCVCILNQKGVVWDFFVVDVVAVGPCTKKVKRTNSC